MVDTSDEWIVERTGIRERRIAAPDEALSDLALPAAIDGARAGRRRRPRQIDLIIVATVTPDMMFPSTGAHPRRPARCEGRRGVRPLGRLHGLRLRARAGATGWSRAASSTRRSSSAATCSRRSSTGRTARRCVLFGDGAGAVVLERVDGRRVPRLRARRRRLGRAAAVHARRRLAHAGERRDRRRAAALREDERPRGLQVRDASPRRLGGEGARTSAASTVDDVDVYVPHQANVRIIDHAAKKLGYPGGEGGRQRRPLRQHFLGLDPARARRMRRPTGGLREGEMVLMTGMGAGLTWGSALIEWTANGKGGRHEQGRVLLPGTGLARGGHGPRDRRGRAGGDGGLRARQRSRRGSTCGGSASRRPSRSSSHTEVQQPALVATSLAVLAALRARGIEPDYVVGHSVGEFAALAAADVARRRSRRSRSSASAASRWPRRRASSPGRWPRSSASTTRSSRRSAHDIEGVWPANYNCPGQIVVSGENGRGRRAAARRRKSAGARRTVKLKVSGAFHCPLVARAAERLRPAVERVKLRATRSRRSCPR